MQCPQGVNVRLVIHHVDMDELATNVCICQDQYAVHAYPMIGKYMLEVCANIRPEPWSEHGFHVAVDRCIVKFACWISISATTALLQIVQFLPTDW